MADVICMGELLAEFVATPMQILGGWVTTGVMLVAVVAMIFIPLGWPLR